MEERFFVASQENDFSAVVQPKVGDGLGVALPLSFSILKWMDEVKGMYICVCIKQSKANKAIQSAKTEASPQSISIRKGLDKSPGPTFVILQITLILLTKPSKQLGCLKTLMGTEYVDPLFVEQKPTVQ